MDSVTLTLPRAQAEEFSHALSDVLCWTRGFMAGCPEDFSLHPIGVEELRTFNIALKKAINASETKP